MTNCAVVCCTNYYRKTKGTNIKYYSFPKDSNIAKIWMSLCRRPDKINLTNACICSIHFDQDSFDVNLRQKLLNYAPKRSRNLKSDAIPTLHLPTSLKIGLKRKNEEQDRSEEALKKSRDEVLRSSTDDAITKDSSSGVLINQDIWDSRCNETCLVNTAKFQSSLNKRILELEQENNVLKIKLDELVSSKKTIEVEFQNLKETTKSFEKSISTIFTSGQIKKLLNPKQKINWSTEDIATAISVRSVSPRAYLNLRKIGYPFPGPSTLRTWASALNLDEGVLGDVITLLRSKLEDDIQHKETQRNFDTHGGVPSKRRKIEKNASRAVSTASNQDPLTTEDDLGQNRDIDEENAFGDNIEHSDNSNSSSRIHFVDVKREIIDEIDIKEEPIGLDDSMDSAYTTQGELHIKKEKEEQFDEFGEFVGVSLKQLPDELADHAKSEIENVLMKFKMLAPNMLTK